MAWMEVRAPAKINLFLELIRRRDDGFHQLETIMTRIGLCDRLWFRRRLRDSQIQLTQVHRGRDVRDDLFHSLPKDSSNLILKAIHRLKSESNRDFGLDVAIEKHIPIEAGLGGGSSDTASTLKAVNRLIGLGIPHSRLKALGDQLGSDTGFFFGSATARCTGRGEQVQNLPVAGRSWMVLGMPPTGLSTAEVFGNGDVPSSPRDSSMLERGLLAGRSKWIHEGMFNRLEQAARRMSPWIERLAAAFRSIGCGGHQMSGSGSAYFGLFPGARSARIACRVLASRMPEIRFYCVSTEGDMKREIG